MQTKYLKILGIIFYLASFTAHTLQHTAGGGSGALRLSIASPPESVEAGSAPLAAHDEDSHCIVCTAFCYVGFLIASTCGRSQMIVLHHDPSPATPRRGFAEPHHYFSRRVLAVQGARAPPAAFANPIGLHK